MSDTIELKATGFKPKSFETQAQDGTNRRCSISIGTKTFVAIRREKESQTKEIKSRQNRPRPPPTLLCSKCHRLCQATIGLLQRHHHEGSDQKRLY